MAFKPKAPAPDKAPAEEADKAASPDSQSLTLGESAPSGQHFGRPPGAGEHSTAFAMKAEAIQPTAEPDASSSKDVNDVTPLQYENAKLVGTGPDMAKGNPVDAIRANDEPAPK